MTLEFLKQLSPCAIICTSFLSWCEVGFRDSQTQAQEVTWPQLQGQTAGASGRRVSAPAEVSEEGLDVFPCSESQQIFITEQRTRKGSSC